MKRALALLPTALPAEAYLLLTVHDEVVVECPEAFVETHELASQQTYALNAGFPHP